MQTKKKGKQQKKGNSFFAFLGFGGNESEKKKQKRSSQEIRKLIEEKVKELQELRDELKKSKQ